VPSRPFAGIVCTMDDSGTDHERWLVIDGRRWRRTDPCLPEDVVDPLTSHLGRARSAVRRARSASDGAALEDARSRVHLAKLGLGERGDYWWDLPAADRVARALEALRLLDD
jgi:hypothetical protein